MDEIFYGKHSYFHARVNTRVPSVPQKSIFGKALGLIKIFPSETRNTQNYLTKLAVNIPKN